MARIRTLLLGLTVLSLTRSGLGADEVVSLHDGGASETTLARTISVAGGGTFSFQSPKPDGAPLSLPVRVEATYQFLDRRLAGTGSQHAAFRAYRDYYKVDSRIEVDDQVAERALRPNRQHIVAFLTAAGLQVYSPSGPLTAREIAVLPTPGDPLMLAALLPAEPVAVGKHWSPPDWTVSMLAGVDIALEQEISCQLASLEGDTAHITLTSTVRGAAKGTEVTTNVSGGFDYNRKTKRITAATVTHVEHREVGPLSPGMDITLTVHLASKPVSQRYAITDEVVAAVGSDAPQSADLAVAYDLTGGISLVCDRKWQLFHRSEQRLILRLLDQGGLVAQCNMIRAQTVAPGTHTPGRTVQEDIRQSLDDDLRKIVTAEELRGLGAIRVYRVTAVGGGTARPRQWRYYLLTAPDGRQVSIVFTVEPANLPIFGNQDIQFIKGLTFRKQAAEDGEQSGS